MRLLHFRDTALRYETPSHKNALNFNSFSKPRDLTDVCKMSSLSLHEINKLFEQVLSPEVLIKFLKSVFEWCHSVYKETLENMGNLKSKNAALRCEYRELSGKLRELCIEVMLYIEIVGDFPLYDRSDILNELDDKTGSEIFELENSVRFPRTIDFLNKLGIWLKCVKTKLSEVNELYKDLTSETKKVAKESKAVEEEASKNKTMARIVTGASGVGTVVGLLAAASISGGLLLPIVGGGIAVASFATSRSFERVQHESEHLCNEVDELHKAACNLKHISELVKQKSHVESIAIEKSAIHRPTPSLKNIQKSFEKIFKFFDSQDLEEEKNGAKKILQTHS